MLRWLRKLDADDSGLAKMVRGFERMLTNGRQVFDLATSAYLGAGDASLVRDELIRTD